jgi:hypothetical protein
MSPLYHAILMVTLLVSSYLTISRQVDEILGAAFSMVGWLVWAFYAFDIVHYSAGSVISTEYRALAFVGIGAAAIMLLFLLRAVTGTLQTADQTRFSSDDLTRGEP